MEKERNKILVIVSDPTFAKVERSVASDGRGPNEPRRYDLVRLRAGEELTRGPADAAVVEPACFASFSAYNATCNNLGIRILVVARDVNEESLVLSTLNPNDDIIRADAVEEQLRPRLERVLLGVRTARIDMFTGSPIVLRFSSSRRRPSPRASIPTTHSLPSWSTWIISSA